MEETKRAIGSRGWAAEILGKQQPGGWWVGKESPYRSKYLSTNWMLLVLADLGLTKSEPRIAEASELIQWTSGQERRHGIINVSED